VKDRFNVDKFDKFFDKFGKFDSPCLSWRLAKSRVHAWWGVGWGGGLFFFI
jgi:hypothetical protein